jgi:flagellar motor switch/type III secretory pathway protein FliN
MENDQESFDFSSIGDVWLELRAELGNRFVPFSELLALELGSILPVGRATGENVDLYAGDVRLGSGEILIVDSTLAVRLADLNDGEAEDKARSQQA